MKRLLAAAIAVIAVLLPSAAAAQTTIMPGRSWIYRLDGSATSPSSTYDADRDTGTYRIGANNEGFAAGGALIFDYNASRVQLASGIALEFSSTSATTGTVRLPNAGHIYGRDNGNTTNIHLIGVDTSDRVLLAGDGQTVLGSTFYLYGGATSGFPAIKRVAAGLEVVLADDSAYTNITAKNLLSTTTIQVGSNVASIGAVRLANNTGTIYSRNAANSTDVLLAFVDSSDRVRIGDGTATAIIGGADNSSIQFVGSSSFAAFGSNPSTTGVIRLANNQALSARNAANSANIEILRLNSSNFVSIDLGGNGTIVGSSTSASMFFGGVTSLFPAVVRNGTTLQAKLGDLSGDAGMTASIFQASTALAVGSNVAASGALRLGHGSAVYGRDFSNSADVSLLDWGGAASDELRVGHGAPNVRIASNLATPQNLSNGDWWVECTGVSPARACAIKVQDGGSTRTIASITY